MDKASLRSLYRQKRNALQPEHTEVLQKQIEHQFSSLDLDTVACIHVFLPIAKQLEVDTWPLIRFLWKSKKTVVTSTTDFNTKTMRHWRIDSKTSYKTNLYGILEPLTQDEVLPSQIDMVLVPLLSFDRHGHRVGYGQGFYDRFLGSCRDDCRLVGLSYFDMCVDIEGLTSYDIPMHHCITPSKTYSF